jgi:O-antigen/teichoic acid export membrane protein
LCELYVRDKAGFDLAATRTLVTTLLIAAPVGAGLAISAGDILRLLPYPAEFQHAAPVLTLLALALPVTGVLMVLSTMAVAIGQERQWIKISAFAVCIFPPLYIGLISWFQGNVGNGATGAALANLIGESALVVWAWVVLPRQLRQAAVIQRGVQIAALAGVMVAAVAALQQLHVPLPVYVPVGAAIYFAGAWLLRLVTPGDLQALLRAFTRRGRRAVAPTAT